MSRNPTTERLLATAHERGDEYYRRLTESVRSHQDGFNLPEIAQRYLAALEELMADLKTIEDPSDKDRFLIESTQQYIDFVHSDIKQRSSREVYIETYDRVWPT